jgi:hypothetical protein
MLNWVFADDISVLQEKQNETGTLASCVSTSGSGMLFVSIF